MIASTSDPSMRAIMIQNGSFLALSLFCSDHLLQGIWEVLPFLKSASQVTFSKMLEGNKSYNKMLRNMFTSWTHRTFRMIHTGRRHLLQLSNMVLDVWRSGFLPLEEIWAFEPQHLARVRGSEQEVRLNICTVPFWAHVSGKLKKERLIGDKCWAVIPTVFILEVSEMFVVTCRNPHCYCRWGVNTF